MPDVIAEWQDREHALAYLAKADSILNRTDGERMVLDLVPLSARRVLDLGTGDGRLMALVLIDRPDMTGLAVDFSETMLESAKARFAGNPRIQVARHDFRESITGLGRFDAVVSSFAIHHLEDERKQSLIHEVFEVLEPGGVFCNLEHVSSPTEQLHDDFLHAIGYTRETEDKSNRCAPVELQLGWMREAGFEDVDCFWKWRELAVLAGRRGSSGRLAGG